METKTDRIKRDIQELARFNATPGRGLTRFSFSPEDKMAREYIKEQMEAAGLKVYQDAAGTVIGRREGTDGSLPCIMVGSHFDSVKNGGNFDGPAGVVTGLEIARVLNENGIKTKYPIEFVALVEEEGGRFGAGLFGSRAMVGKVSEKELAENRDENGITTGEAMKNFGLDPRSIESAKRLPGSVKAFMELHIEQGPVLEAAGKDIGIVNTIVGLRHYEVEITGRPDHAGTTPMDMRADALVLAARVITGINQMAKEAGEGTVATVGSLKVSPGATNIVPGRVVFTMDIRSAKEENIQAIIDGAKALLEEGCAGGDLSFSINNKIAVSPVHVPGYMTDIFKEKCEKLGFSYKEMISGAGHDAMVMAEITDSCLIFVPSKDGRSHCPEEWTDYEQIQKGAQLMLEALLEIAEVEEA